MKGIDLPSFLDVCKDSDRTCCADCLAWRASSICVSGHTTAKLGMDADIG